LDLADCPLELDAEGRMLDPRKTISSIQVVGANYVHEGVTCRLDITSDHEHFKVALFRVFGIQGDISMYGYLDLSKFGRKSFVARMRKQFNRCAPITRLIGAPAFSDTS
jgi:hypothetical protein